MVAHLMYRTQTWFAELINRLKTNFRVCEFTEYPFLWLLKFVPGMRMGSSPFFKISSVPFQVVH